jgi:hypothetical protein
MDSLDGGSTSNEETGTMQVIAGQIAEVGDGYVILERQAAVGQPLEADHHLRNAGCGRSASQASQSAGLIPMRCRACRAGLRVGLARAVARCRARLSADAAVARLSHGGGTRRGSRS